MGYAARKKQESVIDNLSMKAIPKDRAPIIRKVYTALFMSLAVTFAFGYLGASYMTYGSFEWCLALVTPFAVIPFLHAADNDRSGFFWLGTFAAAEGLSFGCLYTVLAAQGHAPEWWTATGITTATFGGLTAYVWATREDFQWMRGSLYNMLWAMIIYGIAMAFYQVPFYAEVIYGVFGIGLFSAFILMDTDAVLTRYSERGVFVAAAHLYLDILNLFLHVLRLLLANKNRK